MRTKINALVVDDNKEFTSSIKEYFCSNAKIKIVSTISDGQEALDYIVKNQENIDVILMDIILPHLDGLSILEKMDELKIQKHVIVLSSYRKEYTVRITSHYGVDYYMLKPCSLESLASRIEDVFVEERAELYMDKKVDREIQIRVSNLLHELGVPSQIKGFQYLREGILMLYQSTGLIGGITKDVYPEIARRYDTTTSRVERAIRHAIEVSWNRADYQKMNQLFGHSIDYDRAKPTNSEFMVTISDALRIDNHVIRNYV